MTPEPPELLATLNRIKPKKRENGMKPSPRVETLRRGILLSLLVPFFVVGIGQCVPRTALAQASESEVPAAVAWALDEQTFGVVGIDTARIDLNGLVQQISAIPVLTERQRKDLALYKRNLTLWLARCSRAGGRQVWIVFTLSDNLMDNPLVIVPLSDDANRQTLERLFLRGALQTAEEMDRPFNMDGAIEREGALVFGPQATLERLRGFHGPDSRDSESRAGSRRRGRNPRLRASHRRSAARAGRVPPRSRGRTGHCPADGPGNGSGRIPRNPGEIARLALGEGLQWVAAGVTTKDNLALKLVIGSKDAVSAKALEVWLAGAWQYAGQHVAAQKDPDSAMIAGLMEQFSRLLKPKVNGDELSIRVDMQQLMASAAGVFLGQAAVDAAKRAEGTVVKNHLKQLVLAMHNYHDVYKQFPPAAIRDAQGRPLLSWRVALLPFLEENQLYHQFHLDEPWDSPHNKPLLAKMPQVFSPRSATLRAEGKTTLLVPVGKQTIFGPPEGVAIREITDGTVNTILIVDADEAHAVDLDQARGPQR